nr:ribonuclease H-like domain-containing protein [Tanacetum cinerariifolium]
NVIAATGRDILLGSVGLPRIQEGMVLLSHKEGLSQFQPSGGYHAIPSPYIGTFMPPKPDLPVETSIPAATPKPESPQSASSGKRRNRKACFSKPVSITVVKPVSAVVPKIKVTRPRHAHQIFSKSKSPIRRHITHSPSTKTINLPPGVTAVQALVVSAAMGMQGKWGNPQHVLKDKGVIDCGCSRHMTGNMSYLSDFEELNSGYVAFGGNLTGGKISGKGKIKT